MREFDEKKFDADVRALLERVHTATEAAGISPIELRQAALALTRSLFLEAAKRGRQTEENMHAAERCLALEHAAWVLQPPGTLRS